MPEAHSQQQLKTHGAVRIRSNVCTDRRAWHLVPGDVIKSFSLPQDRLTQKQKAEMLYYERCCMCHRTIFESEEDGCDYAVCRQQGMPSFVDAQRRRKPRLDNAETTQG
jgi:hypothetical protein